MKVLGCHPEENSGVQSKEENWTSRDPTLK